MAHYIPLQKELHLKSGYKRAKSFLFAQEDSFAPVLLEELSHITQNLPLGFVKDKNGNFILVVLLSLVQGKNMLVHPSGKWFSGYIPSHYRAYPFALLRDEKTQNLLVSIDQESNLLEENKDLAEEYFFNEEGELSEFMQKVMEFLKARLDSSVKTQKAVQTIAQAEIITPWEITLQSAEGEKQKIEGFYKIDETKLNTLDAQAFLKLRSVLPLIYTIILSESRLQNLSKLIDLHKKIEEKSTPKKVEDDFDLDKFFAEQDSLSF